jgi:hypothetical protein
MRKIVFFLSAFLIAHVAYNQCPLGVTQYPTATIVAPANSGDNAVISTCNWYGDYSVISGLSTTSMYQFNLDSGGYVTIYDAITNTVLDYGTLPFTYVPTSTSGIFVQWSLQGCGIDSSTCHNTNIVNLGSSSQCSSVTAGTTITSNAVPCSNQSFTLSLSGNVLEANLSAQWQSSTDGITYNDITGETNYSLTTSQTASKYYRCKITCNNGGAFDFSTPIQVATGSCFLMANGSVTTCGGNFYDSGGQSGTYQVDENLTLTVYPATLGSMVRVNFSSFLVEDGFDSLVIYNGNSTSAPLMGSYFTSPGIVTSSAVDGSLTFAFNSDFMITDTGWDAVFSCYNPFPCVDPAQAGTVTGSNVVCMGDNFELNLDGASTGVGMVYQWQSSTDGITFTDITGATDTILNISQNVATYYRCVSTCSGGTAVNSSSLFVELGTCYTMTNGNITTCDGLFFDTGGQNNTYQNNETYTLTVYPATPGAMLKVDFSSFAVEDSYDSLIIYNGNSTSSPMVGSYFTNPGLITSSASDGSLTFVFNSDFSNVDAGWKATFSCYNPIPCVNPVQTGTAITTSEYVCSSDTFELSITGVTDGFGMTYQWQSSSDGVNFVDIAGATDTVYTTAQNSDTYYRCVATCSAGMPSPSTAVFVAMQAPTVNAGQDTTVCQGTSLTLTGSSPLTMTYQWDNGIVDAAPFQINATTTYTVTGVTQGGCTASDQVTITVLPAPSADAGADQSICAGESVILNGAGSGVVSWDNSVQNGISFIPNTTATYVFSVLDITNGCSSSDSVLVTVNQLPTVDAGVDQTVCMGNMVTLNASGASNYLWDFSVTNGVPFALNATTIFTVTGTDNNGCSATDQVTISVSSTPAPVVDAGADQAICPNTAITLTGTSTTASLVYTWDNGVVDGLQFVPNGTTTYTLTGTSIDGCAGTDQVVVTVLAEPIVDAGFDQIICLGASVTLSASGANQFTWNNGVVDGVSFVPNVTTTYTVSGASMGGCTASDQVTITVNYPSTNTITTTAQGSYTLNGQVYTASGTYTQTLTNANGCDSTIILNLTISNVGLDENQFNTEVKLYPNPTHGVVSLQVSNDLTGSKFELVDAVGKVVLHGVIQTEQSQLDLSVLKNGMYLFRLQNDSRFIRIMKQ